MADLDIFRDEFVPNIQGHARLSFTTWQKSSPADAARWIAYRDALLAGGTPTPPAMTTKYGKALVAVGKLVSGGSTPPPPPSETPWTGYSHALNQVSNISLPDRHFNYRQDGSLDLTLYEDTPLLGSDRQLISAYLPMAGHAGEGKHTRYQTRIAFPSNFKGSKGEVNFWFEWHTMSGQGSGQLSCAIGGRCDFPQDGNFSGPGENLAWFIRPTGPNGSPPLAEMIGPPVQVGRSYELTVEILWSSSAGRFRCYLDGQLLREWQMATLWPGDEPILGVYHYRLAIAPLWSSSLNFTKPTVTVL